MLTICHPSLIKRLSISIKYFHLFRILPNIPPNRDSQTKKTKSIVLSVSISARPLYKSLQTLQTRTILLKMMLESFLKYIVSTTCQILSPRVTRSAGQRLPLALSTISCTESWRHCSNNRESEDRLEPRRPIVRSSFVSPRGSWVNGDRCQIQQ